MNSSDRQNIGRILGAITSDETTTIINVGLNLLKEHPRIKDHMSQNEIDWWLRPGGIDTSKDKMKRRY